MPQTSFAGGNYQNSCRSCKVMKKCFLSLQDEGCTMTSLELSQSLTVVFEPTVMNNGRQDWSFKSLFSRMLSTSCPLAENSKVYIDISSNKVRKSSYGGLVVITLMACLHGQRQIPILIPTPFLNLEFAMGSESDSMQRESSAYYNIDFDFDPF